MARIRSGYERIPLDVPDDLMQRVRQRRGRGTDAGTMLRLLEQALDLDDERVEIVRLRQETMAMMETIRGATDAMKSTTHDLRDGVLTLLDRGVPPARR
ncbi:hypothetical protein ABNQ39_14900 [Azospirillum sp. A26]|uniref:hypothetical protein n=1 Tax=Azospirillum sp. A26 TaxID=3160607 RepID=UPI0036730188